MRAILQKRDEAQLRISTRSPAGGGTPKLVFVLLGVGHIQGAAVQANQSPSSIPRPARLLRSDRYNYLLIQSPQGFRAQTGARLRNAALAGGPHGFLGLGQPLDAFQQAAQHFPRKIACTAPARSRSTPPDALAVLFAGRWPYQSKPKSNRFSPEESLGLPPQG